MAAVAHIRVVIGGTLPGSEVFATGFDLRGEAGNQATLQSIVDDVRDYLMMGTGVPLQSLLSADSAFTSVTGYSYAAGSNSASLIAQDTFSTVGTGGARHPNQVALVATLRTGLPGRRNRGRMFWPATGVTVGVSGLMTGPTAAAIATAVAGLLTAAGTDPAPVVVSRVAGTANDVTQVTVDSRLDTQRGRANKQDGGPRGTAVVA